jgi:hypothetical protein
MNHFLLVDMVKANADHSEYSENLLFWNWIFLTLQDDVLNTLIALFHNNAWEVIFIFDKIYDSNNHRVIECS